MNDFQRRLRIATSLAAIVLGWFSLATIFAEALTPVPQHLSFNLAAQLAPISDGLLAQWSAAVAPLRGDLLADVAIMRAVPTLKLGKAPASPEIMATRESALSAARQSLSFSPHASRTWLLVATLQSFGPARGSATEALKMSYLTSPTDLNLIPTRLAVLLASTATADADLAKLARGDIRLILTRRPDLKAAISEAYDKGSPEGKAYMYEVMRSLDPSFAAMLQ